MTLSANPDPSSNTEDARWMRRALLLARQAHTHPNPMVGAVIVQNGVVVGQGWHQGVGTPHAEAAAFADAGEKARGATIYVTLEPCAHHFREDGTPRHPCAARCIEAGVVRVVAAMEDPDTRVAGRGFAALRAHGILVRVGIEEAQARALNVAYIHHRRMGLPFITHKAALTLDGKTAAPGGDSRWITSVEARNYVHQLRNRADAIVVGIGTVLADDPSLTTRLPEKSASGNERDPLRVIIDSSLRTPPKAKVARPGTLILTAAVDDAENGDKPHRRDVLKATGAEVVEVAVGANGRVDVRDAARVLAERGLLDVLLESGGGLAASFWEAGLVGRALFFVAPKVIGGQDAPTAISGPGFSRRMNDALRLGRFTVRRFGPDVALEAMAEAEVIKHDVYRDH